MRLFLEHSFRGLYYFLTDKAYRSFMFLLLRYGQTQRFKTVNINVFGFRMRVPDAKSFIYQFQEIFYKRSYQFITSASSPLIYDCGANVGTSCLFFKKEYPTAVVHAFEPDPKVFSALKHNMEVNGIKDVHLHNAAVWKEEGSLSFASEGADSGALITERKKESINVKAIRLRDLLAKEQRVDLLKIDIEGAETAVVEDCQDVLDRVEHLFIEYHSFNGQQQTLHTIIQILQQNNFRCYFENESLRKIPFVNQKGKTNMDMQLNIFAYR